MTELHPTIASFNLANGSRAMFDLDPAAVRAAEELRVLREQHELERQADQGVVVEHVGDLAIANS